MMHISYLFSIDKQAMDKKIIPYLLDYWTALVEAQLLQINTALEKW